jgi:hypothetical protein
MVPVDQDLPPGLSGIVAAPATHAVVIGEQVHHVGIAGCEGDLVEVTSR